MKKTILFFILIIFSSVILTSCVDIVQSINFKDGKYKMDYRITISKATLKLADTDFDSFYTEDFDDLPNNTQFEKIDTEFDSGIAISFLIEPRTSNEEFKEFLPKTLGNGKIKIPLFAAKEISESINDADGGDYAQITGAFFASSKWRVYIAKKIIPSISSVCLRYKYGANDLSFYEIGETYCIEIPLLLISKDSYLELEKTH